MFLQIYTTTYRCEARGTFRQNARFKTSTYRLDVREVLTKRCHHGFRRADAERTGAAFRSICAWQGVDLRVSRSRAQAQVKSELCHPVHEVWRESLRFALAPFAFGENAASEEERCGSRRVSAFAFSQSVRVTKVWQS